MDFLKQNLFFRKGGLDLVFCLLALGDVGADAYDASIRRFLLLNLDPAPVGKLVFDGTLGVTVVGEFFFEKTGLPFTKYHIDNWRGARNSLNASTHIRF